MGPINYKKLVLEMDSEAEHSLGQYAYIRGFEDCSDEIITLGRCLSQDCNGEEDAWCKAYYNLLKEKESEKKSGR
jgi:hypothetical protein